MYEKFVVNILILLIEKGRERELNVTWKPARSLTQITKA